MVKTKAASAGPLHFHRSGELKGTTGYTVLLYGTNGSGKTHFASTWPAPLWIVPTIGVNELRTVEDYDLPYIVFNSLDDLNAKLEALGRHLRAKREFKTLVFDSLTTTQTMFEDEIKSAARVDKMDWDQWGKFTAAFVHLMRELHGWPVHKIWICHTDTEKTYSLKGDSRQLFPNNADIILYTDYRDVNGRLEFRVHSRRYQQWPARVRRSAGVDDEGIPILGPNPSPHYDQLAPYLGLRSQAEEEAQ